MARYALLKNGIVINVIVLDAEAAVLLEENSPVGLDDTYDSETGVFTKAPEPEAVEG